MTEDSHDDREDIGSGKESEAHKDQGASRPEAHHSPHYRANNQGGYGNPPVGRQFKKGDKGGPGRRKGVNNLESAMRKAAGTRLSVNKGGRTVTMLPAEILADRTIEAILAKNPSPRMIELGHLLLGNYGPIVKSDQPKADFTGLNDAELIIFGGLLDRISGFEPKLDREIPSSILCPDTWWSEGNYRVFRREDGHIALEPIENGKEED